MAITKANPIGADLNYMSQFPSAIAAPKDPRGSARERGYGHQWSKLAKMHVQKNPKCVRCGRTFYKDEKGKIQNNTADHIKPMSEGGKRLDVNNLQTLCKPCHGIKTQHDIAARKEKLSYQNSQS